MQVAKIRVTVARVLNDRRVPVKVSRDRNHRRGDVHANHTAKSPGERLRQPPDAATEVQRGSGIGNELKLSQLVPEERDLALAITHELLQVPLAALLCRIGKHGPHGVIPGVVIPVRSTLNDAVVHQRGYPRRSARHSTLNYFVVAVLFASTIADSPAIASQ